MFARKQDDSGKESKEEYRERMTVNVVAFAFIVAVLKSIEAVVTSLSRSAFDLKCL